jgi:large subunit ribosomal protein L22
MEIKANVKNIRISPRKVRLVAGLVRGAHVNVALDQLNFTPRLAKKPIIKLLNSAIANAVHNFELDKNNLFIKEIKVDEGTVLKRWMPRAHGRATPIRKKTSHISIILGEIKDGGVKEGKKQVIEPATKLGGEKIEAKDVKREIKPKKTKAKDAAQTAPESEIGKTIVDPRMEGRHGHAKIEGGSSKGFVNKMFRRKSG